MAPGPATATSRRRPRRRPRRRRRPPLRLRCRTVSPATERRRPSSIRPTRFGSRFRRSGFAPIWYRSASKPTERWRCRRNGRRRAGTRGPRPGENGPAVIAGHVDSTSGPAVFFRLRDLRAGDEVLVTRADHSVVRFVIDRLQAFPKTSFPTAAVFAPTPVPALRLITCTGAFDETAAQLPREPGRVRLSRVLRLFGDRPAARDLRSPRGSPPRRDRPAT